MSEDLKAKAEELGIKVDGRWSEKKLLEEIEKAESGSSSEEGESGGDGDTGKPEAPGSEIQDSSEQRGVDLVVMVDDDGKTADVHPEMVDEYRKGGWTVK